MIRNVIIIKEKNVSPQNFLSPFCRAPDTTFCTSVDVSSGVQSQCGQPLVWHLLTSWWLACQLSHSLPCTCKQAMVGLKTGIFCADAASQWDTRQILYQLSYAGLAISSKNLSTFLCFSPCSLTSTFEFFTIRRYLHRCKCELMWANLSKCELMLANLSWKDLFQSACPILSTFTWHKNVYFSLKLTMAFHISNSLSNFSLTLQLFCTNQVP